MEDAGLVGQEPVGQRLPAGDRVRRPVPEDELPWLRDELVGGDQGGSDPNCLRSGRTVGSSYEPTRDKGAERVNDEYPVRFAVEYPDRDLNRLTTALCIFMVIPIAIVAGSIGGYNAQISAVYSKTKVTKAADLDKFSVTLQLQF